MNTVQYSKISFLFEAPASSDKKGKLYQLSYNFVTLIVVEVNLVWGETTSIDPEKKLIKYFISDKWWK